MTCITKFSKYVYSNQLLSINEDGISYDDNTCHSIDHRLFFQLHQSSGSISHLPVIDIIYL